MKDLIVSNKQLPTIKEGIVKGLEVASGARSSATYYHKKGEMQVAVRNSVTNLYQISKELPLLLAVQRGATGFFIQEAIMNELKQTEKGGACNIVNPADWYDEGFGQHLLLHALYNLDTEAGITYVLRMFTQYRDNKINNSRARKLALRFIWGHPNLEFISVKYRGKLREILSHVYGKKVAYGILKASKRYVEAGIFDNDKSRKLLQKNMARFTDNLERSARIYMFIFGSARKDHFDASFKIITQFFGARQDIFSATSVPEEILVGIIGDKSHPQYREFWGSKEKRQDTLKRIRERNVVTTANQQVRQTKKNQELGVTKEVDLKKVTDFLALYKTGYETGFVPALNEAIEDLAGKRRLVGFAYQNIGIVLDRSASMTGHKQESKNTPRAIAEFTALVLRKSVNSADVSMTAAGDNSDIASAFLDLVDGEKKHEAIFIISDGYENSYDGLLNEVIKAWRDMTESATPIYHISPVVGAELNAKVRSMGNQISTIAVNRPEALNAQISAKLLEQDTKRWLENQFRMLSEQVSKRASKAVNV